MKKLLIIADSGGTKTDWLIYNEKGEIKKLLSESYHPRNIDGDFILRNKLFWSGISNLEKYQVQFYGSGCLKSEKALKMKEALLLIGFRNVEVQSDMHAAALAVCVQDGWIAICGTGSVVFEMKNGNVSTIRGGLGKELGDEGSGYYFGKLLAENVLSGKVIVPEIPIKEFNDKENYSTFAKRLSKFKNQKEIIDFHRQNIELFSDKHLNGISKISFVGSYAFYCQTIFKEILQDTGIQVTKFVERPIEVLIEKLA